LDCPNITTITIKELEQIDQITLETNEEDEEMEEEAIVLALNVHQLLILQMILHAMEDSKEESQRKHIFRLQYAIQCKVHSLITDRGCCANIGPIHLIEKLILPSF